MKFRKKPVVIEAMQFTNESKEKVFNWIKEHYLGAYPNLGAYPSSDGDIPTLKISTLEGEMKVQIGDWVIRGVKGEFYPCKPDIFEATYESVSE